MDATSNLNLPFIMAAQAQKHVTHNEALRALDALVQLMVLDKDLAAPPGSPAEGARYIVGSSPTGAWSGQAGRIAAYQDAAWAFYAPREGWAAWVADEDAIYVWSGSIWVAGVALWGINATADTTNRFALASPASLFNHAGNGHQQKINKNAAGDTASQVFQTAFSGRAEYGLTGDDDFHLKVSPDGSAWHEAIHLDRNTGAVNHVEGAKFEAVTNFENYIAANTWTKVQFNVANHNDQGDFIAGNNRFVAPFAGTYLIGAKWRFKANAAVPTQLLTRLYKNGSALAYTEAHSAGTVVTLATMLQTQTVLKLTAGDYIELFAFMATNDGYVDDDNAVFYGARIA
jgi:hypothetical protein